MTIISLLRICNIYISRSTRACLGHCLREFYWYTCIYIGHFVSKATNGNNTSLQLAHCVLCTWYFVIIKYVSLLSVAMFSCIIFVILAVRNQWKKLSVIEREDAATMNKADDQAYAPDCEHIPLEKQVLSSYRYTPSHRFACRCLAWENF